MPETTEAGKQKKEPAPKFPVSMRDGRTLEFTERQKCLTEKIIGADGKIAAIRFDFKTGDSLTVTREDRAALEDEFGWHGVEQKYRDEFASAKDAADAFEWVTDLHSRIQKGDWGATREGGGVSGAGLLVQALMELSGQSRDEIKAYLADKSRKDQEIMRDYGPVSDKIKEIKARTAGTDSTKRGAELVGGLLGTSA